MLKTEAGFVKVCGTLTKTPVKTRKLCGKYKDSSPSSEDSSPPNRHSCLANLGKQAENSITHTQVAEDITPEPGRNKYVHFKGEGNEIPSSSSGSDLRESKPLPYPTPLKLTDEMQTPGTVFPATFETLKNRKYQHIRSQYVYPVHNLHQSKKSSKEEGSYSNQMSECVDETPGDKIIMGRVAADWNEEEFCSISPKWLDRNGIQNSDNKYNEDQNVD
ncbi:protein JASON-like [Impatiens glandulifera]|uniref:protein JASON-like n=1 Tax=Impatiens glandulifera TaxID=253017 RepID=UPI001FB19F41|nr:protein JASON-like [Impatiens glandulifera]